MITGNLIIVGSIDVEESEERITRFPLAMLITFSSAAEIKEAMNAGECKFTFLEPKS
jgi:hypothetical protein